MNILVLGSEGQIGKPFCSLAESEGHTILKVDKVLGPCSDLTNPNSLIYNVTSLDFDVCLFLAFEVGGSKYLKDKDSTFDYILENTTIMANAFRLLRNNGKPFLFASSQMSNMHHTNYGFLKDLGERFTRSIGGSICRFWNVYGYEDPASPKSHVITDFIHSAKLTGKINMRTNGLEERQFLHTDDCSRALLFWCEHNYLFQKDDYLDITSFEWVSIIDVAKKISQLTGAEVIAGTSKDTIQLGIKNKPNKAILNYWQPKISLEEGIRKLL